MVLFGRRGEERRGEHVQKFNECLTADTYSAPSLIFGASDLVI